MSAWGDVGSAAACHCLCGRAHPSAIGICGGDAVTTRPIVSSTFGPRDVPMCQPCAVASDAIGYLHERQQGEQYAARHEGEPDREFVIVAICAVLVVVAALAYIVLAS